MMSLKGTLAHEIHFVAMADQERTDSPAYDKNCWNGQGIENSALDKLLETDEDFYRMMNRELGGILVRMRIPPFLIEDLVQEAWLSAIQHRDLFVGGHVKRRLRGFLRKVVRNKVVDVRRHSALYPCQSFDGDEMEWRDEAEARHSAMAEQHELLEALLDDAGGDHEENKCLVRAHFFQGVTVSELAERSGITVDAVDSRIRRVLDKMRDSAGKFFQQQVQV